MLHLAPLCTTLHHFAPLVTLMYMEIVAASQTAFFKKEIYRRMWTVTDAVLVLREDAV
jgi:uncharacterized protein involved in cysteine biosynthesis